MPKSAKEKEKKQNIKSNTKKNTRKQNTKKKAKVENTKEEKFNFDDEIIIGLRRIDAEEDKPKTKTNSKGEKRNQKNTSKQSTSSKQNRSKKKEKKKEVEDELDNIHEIGSNKKNVRRKQKRNDKNTVNQNKNNSKRQSQKKLTPEQELAKKKRKVIFRITKWIMLFAIIIGAGIYALLSPIFNIKNINVVGNSKISSEEIISLSRIDLEQNMFKYRKSNIIKNIKENAYIDNVEVSRKIPDTIEVTVTERKASFMLQIGNAYAYISSQGYILEISNTKANLPILEGFETNQEDIQVGYRLCTADLQKLSDVLKIMEAATSNKLAKFITKINMSDDDNYILTLEKKKKTVYLGDTSNLSTKMLWILKFNEVEKNTQGDIILNMNLNDEKNKPYFRKKV